MISNWNGQAEERRRSFQFTRRAPHARSQHNWFCDQEVKKEGVGRREKEDKERRWFAPATRRIHLRSIIGIVTELVPLVRRLLPRCTCIVWTYIQVSLRSRKREVERTYMCKWKGGKKRVALRARSHVLRSHLTSFCRVHPLLPLLLLLS